MNKIKVIWICHFTNVEMQKLLPLWRTRKEASPWIPNFIKGFENRKDFELHVISPHEFLKKNKRINLRGVYYHFIPAGFPIISKYWPSKFKFDSLNNFYFFRQRVKRIVKNINPDIINLMGAENAYYSAAILDYYNKYPVLITIQGFISEHKDIVELNMGVKNRIDIEENILQKFQYFSGELDSSTYINNYNPKHDFFLQYFPVNEDLLISRSDQKKQYDCIYFGRLAKSKGAEDFVKVIGLLKKNNVDIRACILGSGDKTPLVNLAIELNCLSNITFIGFVKTQEKLFEFVNLSKIVLVPSLKDRLPSSIREAMFLKVPIVAYATGGIPFINKYSENICLVGQGDYKDMAIKVERLLNNVKLRQILARKAYEYAIEEYSLKNNTERLVSIYHEILKHKK